jgi:site-specific recombinase XerC
LDRRPDAIRPSKRSKTYGTILINLEDGSPVDLLPDRQAATLETWLKKSQKEAVKVARNDSLAKEQGTLIEGPDQTLSTFLTSWIEDTAQYNVRPRTYIRYRGIIYQHILPTLGQVKLQKLAPQQLQRLYNQKRQEGYAPQSVRHIHLSAMAIEALKRHRIRQNEQRLAVGPGWHDQNWVFCNTVGGPIDAGNLLRRSYWPLLAKACLERMPFHSLRHSAASLLFSLGIHPKVVQELLGHSNINMTLDIYSHVIPAMHADAVQQLSTLLSQSENAVAVTGAKTGTDAP